MLVITLEGAAPETLAEVSRTLNDTLRGDEHFRFITNGDVTRNWAEYDERAARVASALQAAGMHVIP